MPSQPPSGGRLRVARIERVPSPDGYTRIRLSLEALGETFSGEAQGVRTREGGLRTGAEAALQAIDYATGGRLRLALLGIKAVRAFDSWIVISSVEAKSDDRHYKLIGARTAESEDMVRGAVLSILDALNRVIELHLVGSPTARP
jgi:hypothetical protein